MKLIIISGPSGSGKTTLSNNLCKVYKNTIVIKTDSYYRDDILIKFLSIFCFDIYDRFISINKIELINTISSILSKKKYVTFHDYNFITKKSSNVVKKINYKVKDLVVIIEGIFAHRMLPYLKEQVSFKILCIGQKELCYRRRLIRDKEDRGRDKQEVLKKFNKSWKLYYKNSQKYRNQKHIFLINTFDNLSYNDLISKLNENSTSH